MLLVQPDEVRLEALPAPPALVERLVLDRARAAVDAPDPEPLFVLRLVDQPRAWEPLSQDWLRRLAIEREVGDANDDEAVRTDALVGVHAARPPEAFASAGRRLPEPVRRDEHHMAPRRDVEPLLPLVRRGAVRHGVVAQAAQLVGKIALEDRAGVTDEFGADVRKAVCEGHGYPLSSLAGRSAMSAGLSRSSRATRIPSSVRMKTGLPSRSSSRTMNPSRTLSRHADWKRTFAANRASRDARAWS